MNAKDIILTQVISDAAGFKYGDIRITLPIPDGVSPTDYHDQLIDEGHEDAIYDAMNEFRGSGEATDIESPYSRHYESEQVALKMGEFCVCWTHWFGGGKHGEPEAIEWIDDAYFVDVTTTTKVVNVYTQKKEAS